MSRAGAFSVQFPRWSHRSPRRRRHRVLHVFLRRGAVVAAVSGERNIKEALAILDRFQIPTVAWRIHATAQELYQHLKKNKDAEMHRERAEAHILALANSFAPDEPLRQSFLDATPVRRILLERVVKKTTRQNKLRRGAAS